MSDDTSNHEHPRRRWSVPPVPEWRRAELQILADVDDALALTLWRAVRDVRAWMETPPGRRATIVQPPTAAVRERLSYAAAQAPELTGALGQFTNLLAAPAHVDPHALAAACAVVAEWAEERAHSETSIEFAEAAAALADEHAAFANLAARVCRRGALLERAEVWYERGIGLARRRKDALEYINARQGYGRLLYQLGFLERAKREFVKAARRAASSGRRIAAAETQHHLLTLYAEEGPLKQVLEHTSLALRNYPLHNARVPLLAHDFAYALVHATRYADAHSLMSQAIYLIPERDQALAWGTLAWAAAGTGLRAAYDDARQNGVRLAALYREYASGTLRHLGEAAALLEDWDDAEHFAAHALEAARLDSDRQIIPHLLRLIDRISVRTSSAAQQDLPSDQRIETLLLHFMHRLRMWKPDGVSRTSRSS